MRRVLMKFFLIRKRRKSMTSTVQLHLNKVSTLQLGKVVVDRPSAQAARLEVSKAASAMLVALVVGAQTLISKIYSVHLVVALDEEEAIKGARRFKRRCWLGRTSTCRQTFHSWTQPKGLRRTFSSHRLSHARHAQDLV